MSWSLALYVVAGRSATVVDQLAGVELPLLAAAVEQLDVVVAVELEVPVGVGGEPVVVAAVEDDGVVVGDALARTAAPRTAPCRRSRGGPGPGGPSSSRCGRRRGCGPCRRRRCPRRPRRGRSSGRRGGPRPSRRRPGRRVRLMRGSFRRLVRCGGRGGVRDRRVRWALRVGCSRYISQPRQKPNAALRNAAARAKAVATSVPARWLRDEADQADDGEDQADGLGEPRRPGVLELGRRAERGPDEPR